MTLKFPPLKALRAFECAARSGSYVDAAEELNVTPAAISQQVRNLEAYSIGSCSRVTTIASY